MRLVDSITLVTAVAALPQPRDQTQTFSVAVSPSSNDATGGRDFVRDWVAAHRKWGGGVSSQVMSALSTTDTGPDDGAGSGRVVANPLGRDDVYIANLAVGNPPQLIKLAVDTSSSDLWTESIATVYTVNHNGPWAPRYRPNMSKTSTLLQDAEWDIRYGDGTSADGVTYHDTVRLGTLRVDSATVKSARIIPASLENETGLSGVLGLSKPTSNSSSSITRLIREALVGSNGRPIITADLRHNASGRIDFGQVADDDSLSEDAIAWVPPVPSSSYWDVDFSTVGWHGSHGLWHDRDFRATVDTATTLLFLPQALAGLYWFDIPGMRVDPRLENAYTFPCVLADSLPDLLFKIPGSDKFVTVAGKYLNYGPVGSSTGKTTTSSIGDGDEDYCWGGMQGAKDLDVAVLGDMMLKAVVVAFDLGSGAVGFANKTLGG
ncbi:hypothetical protein GMORB2_0122 [Geosmithia morbida]|uniref:Peptidase A1 domain-containing protein n=1 Tax=Geosmithia morbida TaxID=1094350 RepID=A0A9P4Z2P3_9HYPO|nr:uncharacterized protein GMORB2_0122 [Geosmithia morbida]KAF4126386.1 hypothetical protein GMORB2_0122 [Geosmithia morbida]